MAQRKGQSFNLEPLDDFFKTDEERKEDKLSKIRDIPIDMIDDFPDHPFKVRDDEDMQNLVESIRERGVITPATVRKKENGRYEMISGHRRMRACSLLGMDTLRCEVVELSRDEATVLMVESNFQRSEILPSEKAFMDKSNERDYERHQKEYENFVAYKNGEYHPYTIPPQSTPLPRSNKFSQPNKSTSEEQDKELDAVYNLLNACKIDDMVVEFENVEIVATDTESEWRGAELYKFLLDDVLTFNENGKLADGYDIDESIISAVKEYAKHYGKGILQPDRNCSIGSKFNR